MSQRANADGKFLLKFLIISIALLGWTLYCLYDGLVAYPKELERSNAYHPAIADIEDGELRNERWSASTTENNWKRLPLPDEPEKVRWSIKEQFIMAAGCTLVALPLLIWYFRKKSSWLESDGKSLNSSWGGTFDYENVTSIDKKRWEKKGIAQIQYKDGGEERQFKLDDLAYDRIVVDQILFDLETSVGHDKIVNGEPERDPKTILEERRKKAEEKAAREAEEMADD